MSKESNLSENVPMTESECVSSYSDEVCERLSPLIAKDFLKANFSETKGAFLQKFLQRMGQALGLSDADMSMMFNGKNNLIRVHADVSEMVVTLYNSIRETGVKSDNLRRHYTAFNTSYFHEQAEIKSLLREFVKFKEINKDPNNQNRKEKILKDNSLNILLAVDGLLGKDVSDLYNYIGNFSVGNTPSTKEQQHVVAVREMYKMIPEMITGTDSTYLVTMNLLFLYNEHNDENSDTYPIVKRHIDQCRDYLWKQGDYYKELNDVMTPEFISKMKNHYSSAVDVKDIAQEKLEQFISTLKKKNESKKRKIEEEDVEEINKKKQKKDQKVKSEE
jgi:hypothetical protein